MKYLKRFNESNDYYEQIFNFNKLDSNGELTKYGKISGDDIEMSNHDISVLGKYGFNKIKTGIRIYPTGSVSGYLSRKYLRLTGIYGSTDDKYNTITVWKRVDDWFFVEVFGGRWNKDDSLSTQFNHWYICDQVEGVVKLLKDKGLI